MMDSATLLSNFVVIDSAAAPAGALKKCYDLVFQVFGLKFNSVQSVDRYLDGDWRDLRITLEQNGRVAMAILNHDGTWLLWKDDLQSRQSTIYRNRDDIMREGFRVDQAGIVTPRRFTRSGRLVLTEEEASKNDLGPSDPDL
ncbi:MAG TPA: hypothetical protein VKX17_21775 [Planctomycetota bacterium]|nr:hypothetical protein [Planctomycetota bacterium]